VCSGRCRAKRWRAAPATRDPEIRAALEAIAQLVQHTLGRLEGGPSMRAYPQDHLAAVSIGQHTGTLRSD